MRLPTSINPKIEKYKSGDLELEFRHATIADILKATQLFQEGKSEIDVLAELLADLLLVEDSREEKINFIKNKMQIDSLEDLGELARRCGFQKEKKKTD